MSLDGEKLLGNLYDDFEMVSKENAIKLEQILDLEDALYAVRILDEADGSPCWCGMTIISDLATHTEECEKARSLTKHLWNKEQKNEPIK